MSNAKPMAAITQMSHWMGVSRESGWLVGMGMLRVSG